MAIQPRTHHSDQASTPAPHDEIMRIQARCRRQKPGDAERRQATLTDVRKVVTHERYPQALVTGLPAERVEKGVERELNDFKEMEVFAWVKEQYIFAGANTLECGWALKFESPDAVRARVGLKDLANTKTDEFYYPIPMRVTLRCLLRYAAVHGLEVSMPDIRVAFMHAPASQVK